MYLRSKISSVFLLTSVLGMVFFMTACSNSQDLQGKLSLMNSDPNVSRTAQVGNTGVVTETETNAGFPQVTMRYPTNSATNIPTITQLVVQFSEPVTYVSSMYLPFRLFKLGDIEHPLTINLWKSPDSMTYVITPQAELLAGTSYSLDTNYTRYDDDHKLRDANGNIAAASFARFTTASVLASTVNVTNNPAPVFVYPSNSSQGIPTNSNFVVVFSEPVVPEGEGSFRLHPSPTDNSLMNKENWQIPGGMTYVVSPQGDLSGNHLYRFVIRFLNDLNGNAVNQSQHNFTTGAAAGSAVTE